VTSELLLMLSAIVIMVGALAVFVGRPLLGGSEALEPADPRAVALLSEREAVLATLRDLDADHASGRLGDDDYTVLRAEAMTRGGQVLAALDAIAAQSAGETAALTAAIEADVAALEQAAVPAPVAVAVPRPIRRFCPSCGRAVDVEDRFCGSCGAGLKGRVEG
jgi:hypothetical protein